MGKTPFQRFTDNLQYAQRMIHGGVTLEKLGRARVDLGALTSDNAPHPDDLYRASWTQCVSALDHWLHEAIIAYIVDHTGDINWKRPARLEALKLSMGEAERLYRGSTPARVVIRQFLERELKRSTYQKSSAITDGLRLALHLDGGQIWKHIGDPLQLPAHQAIAKQDGIGERRDKIAHRADLDEQGQRTPMSATDAQLTLDWIAHVGTTIAGLLR